MSGCEGKCSCGSNCNRSNNCGGLSKMPPDLGFSERSRTEILIAGVAPTKKLYEGSEMNFGAEVAENGCKCGSNCSCDPCNCN